MHNVQNACSAIAIAREIGIDDSATQQGLEGFNGVGRRFTRYGDIAIPGAGGGSFALVDDFGHHPVETEVTLAAARGAYPGRRLVLAFQPHRFSRTRDLFEDFVKVLASPDVLLLADVYAAGEAPIVGANGRALAHALRVGGKIEPIFVESIADMPATIMNVVRDGDVVITMGAGSISGVPAKLTSYPKA
jgi:UDP-N-acetylmuramate--alanine ligase